MGVPAAAQISCQLYDNEYKSLDLLYSASVLDLVFKKLEIEREQRRYERFRESITIMNIENSFASSITQEKAHDILWALTGRDMYKLLVLERNWSSDEYEMWLGDTLIKTLL